MPSQRIANLFVDFEARLAGWNANLDAALKKLTQTQIGIDEKLGKITKAFGVLGKAAGVVLGAFTAAFSFRELDKIISSSLEMVDSLTAAAKAANLTTKALQEYRSAGAQVNVGQVRIDIGLRKFNENLGKSRSGVKKYVELFRRLGVVHQDTTEQALEKAFTALANIEDASVRAALASDLFGRFQSRMTLLVRDGADGLDELKDNANKAGQVLSNELLANAEQVTSEMGRLAAVMKGELHKTVLENLDGFVAFKRLMNDIQRLAIKLAGSLGDAADAVKRIFNVRISDSIFELRNNLRSNLARQSEESFRAIQLDLKRKDLFEKLYPTEGEAPTGRELSKLQRSFDDTIHFIQVTDEELEKLTAQYDELVAAIHDAEAANEDFAKSFGGPGGGGTSGAIPGTPSLGPAAERNRKAWEEYDLIVKENIRRTEEWARANDQLAMAFEFAFENRALDALFSGKFGQAIKDLTRDFAALIIRMLVLRPLAQAIFGSLQLLPGPSLAGASVPSGGVPAFGRASGGPVTRGQSYIVGEEGPEAFVAPRSGFIVPNDALAGAGMNVQVVNRFDVGLESVDDRIATVSPQITASVVAGVMKAQSRSRFV